MGYEKLATISEPILSLEEILLRQGASGVGLLVFKYGRVTSLAPFDLMGSYD